MAGSISGRAPGTTGGMVANRMAFAATLPVNASDGPTHHLAPTSQRNPPDANFHGDTASGPYGTNDTPFARPDRNHRPTLTISIENHGPGRGKQSAPLPTEISPDVRAPTSGRIFGTDSLDRGDPMGNAAGMHVSLNNDQGHQGRMAWCLGNRSGRGPVRLNPWTGYLQIKGSNSGPVCGVGGRASRRTPRATPAWERTGPDPPRHGTRPPVTRSGSARSGPPRPGP